MTLQKDQDPGWWRRGMTRRAQIIIVTIAVVAIIGAIILMVANGISFF